MAVGPPGLARSASCAGWRHGAFRNDRAPPVEELVTVSTALPERAAGAEGRAEKGERFRALDAWRGVCALIVAASHFNTSGLITNAPLIEHAGLYVDFFFVLSGFVISHGYLESLQRGLVADFLVRRVARLWPLHAAVLLASIVIAQLGAAVGLFVRGWDYATLPATFALVHSWGFLERSGWNLPSWSISTEMFAYLLFALVAWLAPARALPAVCGVILVAAAGIVVAVAPDGMGSIYDFGIARCLFGFMAGALAHAAWRRLGWRPRGETPALVAMVAALLWLPERAEPLIVPLFAWAVLVFAGDRGPVSRLLHRPLPQLLGRLSYSIYLVHYLTALILMTALMWLGRVEEIDGTATFVAPIWATETVTIAYLLLVVLSSAVTYRFVERPGQKLFNPRPERVPADW